MFTRGTPIFSSIFSRAEASGLGKALPQLLKTGATLALTCVALAHSPQSAQAQSKSTKAPILQFGVPLVGPAPISDIQVPDVCWAPGTPASTIAAFERRQIDNGFATSLSPYRTLGQGRWTRTATEGGGLRQGQPTTIRYSIVPDGTPIPGFAGEPDAPSNLQARLTQIYGSKATWLALFAQAGAALSAQSGLTYVYEDQDDGALFGPNANGEQSPGIIGTRGDVRISGHRIDGSGNGVLAYNFSPDVGDMVIDTADDFYEDRRQNDLGFRNVVTHEFGHGVGLGHTCPINETKLMEPFISFNFDGPQFDDIRGLQRFYGDPLEDNDTGASGTNLGALGDGTVNVAQDKILSIDDGKDDDFFRFSTLANKSLSITVRPTGAIYFEGPQNDDGSCTPGTRLDPKLINNLGFELLQADSTGAFVSVATTNSAPVGGTETLVATNFPAGGQFQIRVFGGDVRDVQTYAIDVTVGPPVVEPTPVPTATVGPTPTPVPTGVPTPTPLPQPTPIRPIVDLNGLNEEEANGQDSPTPSGIDATAKYFFRKNGPMAGGGAQRITTDDVIVLSDISGRGIPEEDRGKAITEARVQLTPQSSCGGIAPDNCGTPNNDQEVLGITAAATTSLNDRGSGISIAYNNATQILTLKGGNGGLDTIRGNYEFALQNVTYENKRVFPTLSDRPITFVVDTDNDSSNDQDNRFAPQDPGNPKQSKPAVLTLQFAEQPSLNVTTTSDTSTIRDQQTSLREAIEFANSLPRRVRPNPDPDPNAPSVPAPPSVITFFNTPPTATPPTPGTPLTGTINLKSPLPPIDAATDVIIQGPGARRLTVNGANTGSSVFQTNSDVTITGLTITGGTAAPVTPDDPTAQTPPAYGGGIYNNGGDLTVDACMISGNSAQLGGGIANVGGSLSLTNSTISGNTASSNGASSGGGIYLDNSLNGFVGFVNISNSTISGNTGSGIAQNSGSSTTKMSTITNNAPAGVSLSDSRRSGTRATFSNTIISGNASDNDVTSNGGTYTSRGYNIIGGGNAATSFRPTTNDRVGIIGNTAGLGVLGNNGGQTDTHALFAGSPAIDSGDPAIQQPPVVDPPPDPPTPPFTDQRREDFDRVVNGRIDVGALEKQNNDAVVNPVITPRNPTTNQTLTANANSDTTNLNYQWTKTTPNGFTTTVQNGPSNTLDLSVPGKGDRGDTITVIVTADNGSGNPTTGRDSVVVVNTPPTFTATITATNPAPNSGSTEVLTNSVLTANLTPADDDPGDASTLTFTYEWKVNGQVLVQETGKTIDLSKPGNGDRGDVVSVTITATDRGGASVTNTVSTTVGNTAPIAQNVTFKVNPGQTVRILLTATDVDTKQPTQANPAGVDTLFKFTQTSNPTKGTATIEVSSDGRGVLVYKANANATGQDSLTFTATDTTTFQNGQLVVGAGAKTSAPATATANPGPNPTPTPGPTPGPTPRPTPGPTPGPSPTPATNRPPAGASFSVNTQREVPIVRAIALSDPDPEDTYSTLQIIRLPGGLRKGTGGIRKDTDGIWKLFYKASRLFQGNDQVQYIVVDQKGARSAPATITINIFNTKPTARSTAMQVAAGGSASVGIFGQDNDNDALTFKRVGGPDKGTGEIRRDEFGNFRFFYQNSPAAVGNDQVQFVALDGKAGGVSEVATIDITVVGIFNRAPSAQNVSGTTTMGTPVAVAVAGTDPDEGDVLTFKRVGGPTNGTGEIALDDDGIFKMFYTPRADFVGTEIIRYVALDQRGRPSAPATITITVTSGSSALKRNPSPSAGSS